MDVLNLDINHFYKEKVGLGFKEGIWFTSQGFGRVQPYSKEELEKRVIFHLFTRKSLSPFLL